ncbi:MFS general substrate transporter [Hypoxylon sp. FL0890]|nr:MFS general substrate transporter [Hypoxylon sp. FL0890]
MSFHSLPLYHELTPGTSSPAGPSTVTPINIAPGSSQKIFDRPPNNNAPQLPQVAASLPEEIQRVFDVAPLNVTNKRRRLAIATLIIAYNLMQMICNLIGLACGLVISEKLGVLGVHVNWVGASYPSYPLTQGTFVLVTGRLGAVYGHKNMLLLPTLGSLCLIIFAFVYGFCNNFIAFNVIHAIYDGITNLPGFVRNLSLAFFGASAPIGGYLGALITGGFIQRAPLVYMFVFIAVISLIVTVALWALPREVPVDRNGKINWIGSFLALGGVIVSNVVWNQAPAVGWSSPMIIAVLIVSVALFTGYYLWTHYFASLAVAAGSLLWHTVLWLQEIRHWTPMQFAVGWTPFGLGGAAATLLAAYLIPRISAQWILVMEQQPYWSQGFPSTIMASSSPDFIYTAAQIIASNAVIRKQQGDNREGWQDPADADPADEVIAPVVTGTELREMQLQPEQR